MKRLLFAAVALVFSTTLAFAQQPQTSKDPSVLPMFGKIAKSDAQQRKDESFLTNCDKNFGSRKEASTFFMDRGWEYYNVGQIDTAVHRFNLAWLLNPDNSSTYWAFGLVSAYQQQTAEAIPFYEQAIKYDAKNSLLLSDIGFAYLTLYKQNKKKKDLKKGTEYLNKSVAIDPNNAFALYNIANVRFYEKKYADAWTYLHKSRELDLNNIDYLFLAELMEKMPDPQGFFKSQTPEATTSN